MIILTIRTDKPEAEIGIFDGEKQLAYETWTAHRQLAETVHGKIETLLKSQHKSMRDIHGIICFKGPGSFTGLRIGLSVANALAYSLRVPIVGLNGEEWIREGIARLQNNQNDTTAIPEYGTEVYTTLPRK